MSGANQTGTPGDGTAALRETTVAGHVVEWLRADGWEVHEEVSGAGCGVADIVALRERAPGRLPLIRRIECKTSLTVDLVQQAIDAARSLHTHFVEVAIPDPRGRRMTRTQSFLEHLLRDHGIGILHVRTAEAWGGERVLVHRDPRLVRIDRSRGIPRSRWGWLLGLKRTQEWCAKHENLVPAGGNRGGWWTPYKGTIHHVREILKRRGELTIGQIMEDLTEHHYSRDTVARSAIPTALLNYETDWCAAEKRNGTWHFSIRGEQS